MKERELAQHVTCDLCNRPVLAGGLPLFWRVRVERFGVDVGAVRRQAGLGAFLGSHALASIMGPDEDVAQPVMDPVTLTVCEGCAMDRMSVVTVAAFEAQKKEPT